jgi:NADPH:quinone reductase-like Zn-dependent oxidoreductase
MDFSSARTCLPPPPAVAATDGTQGDRHRDRVEPGQARPRATGGHGAAVVIDFAGASHWDKNIAALAPDGRLVMLSFLSGRELEKVDIGPLLFKRLRVQGTTLRARSVPYQADLVTGAALSLMFM